MNLNQLIEHFITEEFVLLAGAGISRNCGIPLVRDIEERILCELKFSLVDIGRFLEQQIPFESFFEPLLAGPGKEFLVSMFDSTTPGLPHQILAELTAIGRLRGLVTTNFDTLAERAMRECGVKFRLYRDEKALVRLPNLTASHIPLVKLHGCVTQPDEMGITVRKVAQQRSIASAQHVLHRLVCGRRMILVGYSCSDKFDVTPALRGLPPDAGPFLLIDHESGRKRPLAQPLTILAPQHPLHARPGCRVRIDANALFSRLAETLDLRSRTSVKSSDDALSRIALWLEACRATAPGWPKYLAGSLYKLANDWESSTRCFRAALRFGLPPRDACRAELATANNLRDLGRGKSASRPLERALHLADQHGLKMEKGRILNSYGMLMADRKLYQGAIGYYARARRIAKTSGDLELHGKVLGNYAIAMKNRRSRGDLTAAGRLQLEALAVARQLGDKRSEGRTLGNLGIYYSSLGKYREALRHYDLALEIARDLGDRLHLGIWLHNAGKDLATSHPDLARRHLADARDIFMELRQPTYAAQSERLLRSMLGG